MPDYDEATFNPDMDVLSPTAITTGTIRAFYLSRQIDFLKIQKSVWKIMASGDFMLENSRKTFRAKWG